MAEEVTATVEIREMREKKREGKAYEALRKKSEKASLRASFKTWSDSTSVEATEER